MNNIKNPCPPSSICSSQGYAGLCKATETIHKACMRTAGKHHADNFSMVLATANRIADIRETYFKRTKKQLYNL